MDQVGPCRVAARRREDVPSGCSSRGRGGPGAGDRPAEVSLSREPRGKASLSIRQDKIALIS